MGKLEALARDFFTEVWEEENAAAIPKWLGANLEAKGVHKDVVFGPDEFAGFHAALCELVTDIRVTFVQSVEAAPWLSVCGQFEGACRKTGAPISISFQSMAQFEGEQMVLGFNNIDFIGLFEQLGQIEPAALDALFTGGRLARA
ncbi:MAG: hypothetical protein AAFN79_03745 [Pseudomonadota bacterium]